LFKNIRFVERNQSAKVRDLPIAERGKLAYYYQCVIILNNENRLEDDPIHGMVFVHIEIEKTAAGLVSAPNSCMKSAL